MTEQKRGAPRSETSRLAILEATAALLAVRGYEQLSIEGIAAEAHVGKQTIYRWWPSKSALLVECLLEGLLMPDANEPPDTGDIRRDLTVWLVGIFAFVGAPENAALIRGLVAASADNLEIGGRLHERLGAGSVLSDRVQRAVDSGDARADLPAKDVGELLIGAVVLRIVTREPVDADLAARLVSAVVGEPSTR